MCSSSMAASDDLSALLETLKLEEIAENTEKTLDKMTDSLDQESIDKEAVVPKLVANGLLKELRKLVSKDGPQQAKAMQLVAELAKIESIRRDCVNSGLVAPLLDLMETSTLRHTLQACRALGNICFDNDEGRAAVDEASGVGRLLRVMKSYLGSAGEGTNKLRIVLCGFLLNLTNSHESLQEKAISQGALEMLDDYLRLHGNDVGTVQMALLTINSLTDSEAGRVHLSECEVAVTVGNLLGSDVSKDFQDNILDLLGSLAESDEVKAQLANSSVPSCLIRLIHSCGAAADEDSVAMGKLTSDLIVLLLTGDPSMSILYKNGEGEVFKEATSWLTSSSEQLQMCGALAIGNFARNDQQCLSLVENGITQKLLALLSLGPESVDPTLQHAVFSALRNLAIPVANKPKMLSCKLLDVVLRYKDTDMTAVQFKLLGLLRMVVDKQASAAEQLGSSNEFVSRLITWCAVEDHAGVKGEANRLVAWIVKNAQTAEISRVVVHHGGVAFLVHMANAEHAVMQNEALVALTLIASTSIREAGESFISADLVPTLKVILTDDDSLSEIICNVFTLIKGLTPSEKLMDLLKLADIPDVLEILKKHKDQMVKDGAASVALIFERG